MGKEVYKLRLLSKLANSLQNLFVIFQAFYLKRELCRQENIVKKFRILLVHDEERILNFLVAKLKASGHEVTTARNGAEALEQVQGQEPDLMILDLFIPEMDGFETLIELRTFTSVPVIILSARGADAEKIRGFNLGAGDYAAKPFSPDEVAARIEVVRCRLGPAEKRKSLESFSLGDVTIDFGRRSVAVRRKEVQLAPIEWLLLNELTQNAGRLMLHEDLLARVWRPEYRGGVQSLRTWLSRLRYKIEQDPSNSKSFRTMPKTGYIVDKACPLAAPGSPTKPS